MRKSFFLLVGGLLFLTACGQSDTATETSSEASAPEPDITAVEQPATEPGTTTQTNIAAAPDLSVSSLPSPYAQADQNNGERLFQRCRACHLIDDSGQNTVGPNLYGVFGRQVGSLEGFRYSAALREAGFEWTPEQMDAFLASPRALLPGNRMSFPGLPRDSDRTDLLAWLMIETASDDGETGD